ncbi:MAG TPA: oligosaccharide flippase family protein, partial [Bacteroidota bacterium]|nr:oligosaccharide flippase family protein [Bacteroidota bacterium]
MKNAIPGLWIAEFTSRILTASATLYVARIIGVAPYGLVGFVSAVLSYLLVFVRFGTDDIVARELSRRDAMDENEKSQLRASALVARLAFLVPSLIVLACLAYSAGEATLQRLYGAGMVVLLGAVIPMEAYLQAEENFAAIAGFRILSNLVNLAMILVFVRSAETSWVVPAATGTGVLASEAVFFRFVRGRISLPRADVLRRFWKYLAGQGMPLFGSMILLLLVGQLSIILVRTFCSADELGRYVAGYKIYDVGNALLV